jgi:hypothetical protein
MKLEDLGIKPALFPKADHLVHFKHRNCLILVPCIGEAESQRIKRILSEHFAEEREDDPVPA